MRRSALTPVARRLRDVMVQRYPVYPPAVNLDALNNADWTEVWVLVLMSIRTIPSPIEFRSEFRMTNSMMTHSPRTLGEHFLMTVQSDYQRDVDVPDIPFWIRVPEMAPRTPRCLGVLISRI